MATPLSEYDQALVRAYRDAYQSVGDVPLTDPDDEVLAILHAHGAVTERQAEIIAFGQARADLDGDA